MSHGSARSCLGAKQTQIFISTARGKACFVAPACREVAYTALHDCACIFTSWEVATAPSINLLCRITGVYWYVAVVPQGSHMPRWAKLIYPSIATRVTVRTALLPSGLHSAMRSPYIVPLARRLISQAVIGDGSGTEGALLYSIFPFTRNGDAFMIGATTFPSIWWRWNMESALQRGNMRSR